MWVLTHLFPDGGREVKTSVSRARGKVGTLPLFYLFFEKVKVS